LIPDYRQLGCRVPAIVVSNLAPAKVVNHGPFEHSSTLKLIESTFGLRSLTARDAHAENLGQVLQHTPRRPIASGAIPTSSEVFGPVSDPAAVCSADSVQSVSPAPKHVGKRSADTPAPTAPQVAGMVAFTREHRQGNAG
jgi:phospholipase C